MTTLDYNLTTSEVAEILNISERTLSRWHALRMGPPRCKLGRSVLYRQSALADWIKANETHPVRNFSN